MSCGLIQMEISLCYVADEHTSNTPWAATCDTIYIAVNYCVRGSVKWPYVVYHRSIINVYKYVEQRPHCHDDHQEVSRCCNRVKSEEMIVCRR